MANIPSFATILADVYEIYHSKKSQYKSISRLTESLLTKHQTQEIFYAPYWDKNDEFGLFEQLVGMSDDLLSRAGLKKQKIEVDLTTLDFIKGKQAYTLHLINMLHDFSLQNDWDISKTLDSIDYEFDQYNQHLPDDPLLAELKQDLLSVLQFNPSDIAEQTISDSSDSQLPIVTLTAPLTSTPINDIQDELLRRVKALNPTQFEHFSLHLIGSIVQDRNDSLDDLITHNGQVGDGGVDGIVKVRRLLGGHDEYFVQCKRYDKTSIGRPELQAFVGAMVGYNIRTGIFITTSKFSKHALEYLEKAKDYKIDLLDGSQLVKYMIEHEIGVKSISQHTIDDEFFKRFEQ
ncbi:MAG: restriction endonuclease [Moraxella sp.]|nr:restriction endonuclease [Moraxella sp.]